MLKVRDLHAGYGKADVLHGVSFDVNAGDCVALVGANGAGKSTTLKCICGLVAVRGGSIEFEGRRIDGLPGHAIVRLGHHDVPRRPPGVPRHVGAREPGNGRACAGATASRPPTSKP